MLMTQRITWGQGLGRKFCKNHLFARNVMLERAVHITRAVVEAKNVMLLAGLSGLSTGISWGATILIWIALKAVTKKKV